MCVRCLYVALHSQIEVASIIEYQERRARFSHCRVINQHHQYYQYIYHRRYTTVSRDILNNHKPTYFLVIQSRQQISRSKH